MDTTPTRNLALELVRVTEAAALSAARFMGRGNKEAADGAAVDAMRLVLNTVDMDGVIVIGEGEKDNAPMLYNGERLGNGHPSIGRYCGGPDRRNATPCKWSAKFHCFRSLSAARHHV